MTSETDAHDWTVLVFNVGSSSLTFRVYRHSQVLLGGKCHRVGVSGAEPSYIEIHSGEDVIQRIVELRDHATAAGQVLDFLDTVGLRFDATGHRFADGGGYFSRGTVVNSSTRPLLNQCASLAPLHNVAALAMIDLVAARHAGVTQYVVFDSTFHSDLPDVARTYALPYELAMMYRKHGFNGLSYADVVEKTTWYLGEECFKAVALHLGTGGSSACAIVNGRSMDTSMGYSPLPGLVMNTRCGDLDPGVVIEMMRRGASSDDLVSLLHRRSGLYGLSGEKSSDIRDLLSVMVDDPRARLAFDVYVYRARLYIGSYAAVMNGIDVLIFTDDVGLRLPEVRSAVCSDMEYLGIRLDESRNRAAAPERIEPLHADGSAVRILAIPNDEERAIYAEGLTLFA